MGGGGYVAGPVGVAALTRRIPLVLSEADSPRADQSHARPLARRVCLAFPIAARKGRATGHRPSDPGVTGRSPGARERSGSLPARPRCSSSGARLERARSTRRRSPRLPRAHFTSCTYAGGATTLKWQAQPLRVGYDLREYLDIDEFTAALAADALVVARAGGSLFEIAAHGLPAILVSYPHASSADHQSANARWMSEAGAAIVVGRMPSSILPGWRARWRSCWRTRPV